MSEHDIELDILAQQPSLNLYTQICLCFSVDDDRQHQKICGFISNGFERLIDSFPWLGGKIIKVDSSEGEPAVFMIRRATHNCLVKKDYTDDPEMPTMDILRQKKFPISMLDEERICPFKTLLGNPSDNKIYDAETYPVLAAQINFIEGGVLLAILGHHRAMDMVGQGQVMHLLSKACRNEEFTREELRLGNLDRKDMVTILDESSQPSQVHSSRPDQLGSSRPAPSPPPGCAWANFSISKSSLADLKSSASAKLSSSSIFISSDDVLSALIWKAISRARLNRLNPTTESTLGRAVDARRYLDIPPTYPGMVANKVKHTLSLQSLACTPLCELAAILRTAIDPRTSDLGHSTCLLATSLAHPQNPAAVSHATRDLGRDVSLSSWTKIECYNLDFGFGTPEAVRRPRFQAMEGVVYFLPRAPDGEVVVVVCLRDEDMEALKGDREWMAVASYIG